MTDQELKDIVAAVVAELEKSGVDFDNEVKEAQDTDLVFVIRETDSGYSGFKVTWKGLLDIITAQATQAKNDAVTAKNTANTILSQVTTMKNNVTTMESNVSTMKTSVETTKSQVEGMKNAVETTKGQVETMKTSVETTKEEVETMKTSVETTKEEVETMKTSVETSKSQVEADKSQVETMKTSIETTKSQVETLKSESETAKETATQKAAETTQAKSDVELMKASVEQTVTDFNALADQKKSEVQGVYQNDLNELKGDLANKLPKSPVNWETWTAEEQASARERMGIPGGYELIEETTLQEDVTLFSRSQEPDGTPYAFSAFCIIAEVIVSGSETVNHLRIDASSNTNYNLFLEYFYREDIINKKINVNYEALSPNLFRLSSEINDKSTILSSQGKVSVRDSDYNEDPILSTIVKKINFRNITLCAGTKIKIYGVRA